MKKSLKLSLNVILAILLIIVNSIAQGQNSKQSEYLTLMISETEQKITDRKIHRYKFNLQKGEFFQVRVNQKGVDIFLLLLDKKGKKLARMDSPNGANGYETLTFVANSTGAFVLEIKKLKEEFGEGNYTIRRELSRTAIETDKNRVAAEEAFAKATEITAQIFINGILVEKKDKKKLETAISEFKKAFVIWKELKDDYMLSFTSGAISFYEAQLEQILLAEQPQLVVNTNHGLLIQSIAFSNDNKILATGGGEGTIKLWEVDSGRQIRTLAGHQPVLEDNQPVPAEKEDTFFSFFQSIVNRGRLKSPDALAFSPDGSLLASGSNAKSIIIWDLATGIPRKVIYSPVTVWFIAFSKDGKTLLSKSGHIKEKNRYRFYDITSGNELKENIPSFSNFQLPWQSKDSTLTASYSEQETTIKLIDSKNSQERVLEGHNGGVRKASFSPSDNLLISGGWDRTVRLWNIENSESIILGKHDSFISSIAFSPNGKLAASGSADLTIKMWDVFGKQELRTLHGYADYISPFAFGKNDNFLVTASGAFAHVWNLKKGKKLGAAQIHSGSVKNVIFAPDKNLLATSDQTTSNITQSARIFPIKQPPDFDTWIDTSVKRLHSDKIIRIWDLENNIQKGEFAEYAKEFKENDYGGEISKLAFSSDGKMLAAGNQIGVIKLLKMDNNDDKTITLKSDESVTSLAFSVGNKYLAVGGNEIITIWNLDDKKEFKIPLEKNFNSNVGWLMFSSDGKTLVSIEQNYQLNLKFSIWDFEKLTIRDSEIKKPKLTFSNDQNPEKIAEVINVIPDFNQKMNLPYTKDGGFYAQSETNGRIGLYDRNRKLVAWLIALNNEDWAVITPNGRFDTNKLEKPEGLSWVFPDEPLKPLSFEIFMRDYYEPRLLPRLIKREEFLPIPSLAGLNRNQPKIENITILPKANNSFLVDVKVEVSSVAGQCFRNDKYVPCESGVYDLRLYRDGQIVGQFPTLISENPTTNSIAQSRAESLKTWRKQSNVIAAISNSNLMINGRREIIFKNIQLPMRADVSQVEFTAYAFNEDRVKSETSKPAIYTHSTSRPEIKRKAYIITVGIDKTTSPAWKLSYAPKSANVVNEFIKDKLKSNYEIVPVQLISDEQNNGNSTLPTKDNIKTVLNILSEEIVPTEQRKNIFNQDKLQKAAPDDLVFLYIASHGYITPDQNNPLFHIVPFNVGKSSAITDGLVNAKWLDKCFKSQNSNCIKTKNEFLENSISSEELTKWLQPIDAGEMALILDSCHSEGVIGQNFKPGPLGDRGFGQLSYDKGMQVFVATQVEKLALGPILTKEHSLLAEALTNSEIQKQQVFSQPFDIETWLGNAEDLVPKLFDEYVLDKRIQRQEPIFFNFTRKR